jgi:pantothenate kinase
VKIELTVNGLQVEAHYHDDEIENVHKPLLQQLAKIHAANPQRRTIVFLCAPPGTGKSTLTTFWEYLCAQILVYQRSRRCRWMASHHYNSWLDARNLRAYKGAPETFDVDTCAESASDKEGEGFWPQYDRQKHDPVEEAIR